MRCSCLISPAVKEIDAPDHCAGVTAAPRLALPLGFDIDVTVQHRGEAGHAGRCSSCYSCSEPSSSAMESADSDPERWVDETKDQPNATLSLPKDRFLVLATGSTTWDALQKDDAVEVTGAPEVLATFLECFDLAPPRVQLHVR